jgi:hypothetical protein
MQKKKMGVKEVWIYCRSLHSMRDNGVHASGVRSFFFWGELKWTKCDLQKTGNV